MHLSVTVIVLTMVIYSSLSSSRAPLFACYSSHSGENATKVDEMKTEIVTVRKNYS